MKLGNQVCDADTPARRWFVPSGMECRLFIAGMLLCLAAKGISAFSISFAVDDILWLNSQFNGALVSEVSARDGRFLYPYLVDLLFALGIDAPKATTLSALAMMASLVITGLLACRVWRIQNNSWACLSVIAFTALFPYQCDFSTWKIGMLTGGIPLVASMFGLWYASTGRAGGVRVAVVLIAASLAIHQIGITWIAVAFCFSLIFAAMQNPDAFRQACLERRIRQQASVILYGVLLYLAAMVLFNVLHGASQHSAEVAPLYKLSNLSLVSGLEAVHALIVFHNPLFSPLLNAGLATLALFFGYACARRLFASGTGVRQAALLAILLGASIAAAWASCVVLPVITLQKGQMFARTLSAFGLMWAGIAAIIFNVLEGGMKRRICLLIVAVMSMGFVAVNNQILTDQLRANQRDAEFARRIYQAVEKVDGFQFIERLAIVGTTSRSLSGLRFALDLSGEKQDRVGIVMSVFANRYPNDYRVRLLNEITGSGLIGALQPDEQRESESYCRYAMKAFGRFPANGSIVRNGALAIVCIGSESP